jgi:hypothetical protein
MREDFLHYVWRYMKFDHASLQTTTGLSVTVWNCGQYLQVAGPDFFNARLSIDGLEWAGNIEIHLKASDWYAHHHQRDKAYDNVVLHVVWEDDMPIFRRDHSEIPTLELKHYVSPETVSGYAELLRPKDWMFCERQIAQVEEIIRINWMERLFFERLERRSASLVQMLDDVAGDWEAVFFLLLAKNFGLNRNGEAFFEMARKLPFSMIRKELGSAVNLESLFFGVSGLLQEKRQDTWYATLSGTWNFLSQKYGLDGDVAIIPEFFRLRPDNFPTIRLSQLAGLYSGRDRLFDSVIRENGIAGSRDIFRVRASDYWETHYQFDRESPKKQKRLSTSFIDLMIINAVVPLRFAYGHYFARDNIEELIGLLREMPPEDNMVIKRFASFGIKAENAFESQSLLQLRTRYCERQRCLECAIGVSLLKG